MVYFVIESSQSNLQGDVEKKMAEYVKNNAESIL